MILILFRSRETSTHLSLLTQTHPRSFRCFLFFVLLFSPHLFSFDYLSFRCTSHEQQPVNFLYMYFLLLPHEMTNATTLHHMEPVMGRAMGIGHMYLGQEHGFNINFFFFFFVLESLISILFPLYIRPCSPNCIKRV